MFFVRRVRLLLPRLRAGLSSPATSWVAIICCAVGGGLSVVLLLLLLGHPNDSNTGGRGSLFNGGRSSRNGNNNSYYYTRGRSLQTNAAESASASWSSSKTFEIPPFQRYTDGAPSCSSVPLQPDDVTYTLVTQLSWDRLWMLEHHCRRWGHENPISVAVYSNRTSASVRDALVRQYGCAPAQLSVQTLPQTFADADYPVNRLRNLALSRVRTTHVAYVDIDFWPSTDLYETLRQRPVRAELAATHKNALVVPALALKRVCGEYYECRSENIRRMPETRDDAIPLVLNRTITAFDPTNFGGHGSTRYAEWLSQDRDELLPIQCVHSNRYEPYLVVRYCRELPPFQTAFSGYGKNKMSWMLQLRREGYRLLQTNSFVVHYPHLDSKARLAWNGGDGGKRLRRPSSGEGRGPQWWLQYKRGRNDYAFVQFRKWLQDTIPAGGGGGGGGDGGGGGIDGRRDGDLNAATMIGPCGDKMDLDDDAKLWVDHSGGGGDEGGASESRDSDSYDSDKRDGEEEKME